jgi:flagellar hook assembly protein FlgD
VLHQNYPNPFNEGTTIRYDIPEESSVTLTIYSVLGQKVRTLIDGIQLKGAHSIRWDGRNTNGDQLPMGVYFVSFRSPRATTTKKIILLK